MLKSSRDAGLALDLHYWPLADIRKDPRMSAFGREVDITIALIQLCSRSIQLTFRGAVRAIEFRQKIYPGYPLLITMPDSN